MFLQINSNMVGKPGPLFRANICMKFRSGYYFSSGRGAADKEELSHLGSMPQELLHTLLMADLPRNLFVLQRSQNHVVIL